MKPAESAPPEPSEIAPAEPAENAETGAESAGEQWAAVKN